MRTLIADDHPIVREALHGFISQRADWQLFGEARHGRDAVALAKSLRPDVVVLDVSMPDLNGLEATRQMTLVDFRKWHFCDVPLWRV